MANVAKRTIFNPDRNKEEQIELPASDAVKEALINFEYPASGIQNMDIADQLANQFDLSDKQRNAQHKSGYFVWRVHVNSVANRLVKSGKLLKIKYGWIAKIDSPDQESPASEDSQSDEAPEVAIERNYRTIRERLETELLQRIMDNSPEFFEELVLDVLVELGYGGSRTDAESVGRSGDGGIDGIIKEDKLGLDMVYVQAKRQDASVSPRLVREFAGSLGVKGAQKGFFITTAIFSEQCKEEAEASDKRIVLIDGKQLVQLMIEHGIGVQTQKSYDIKQIDRDYFSANEDDEDR
ncbi:MAG: restriction endonuclease [Candidatus Poribacteria bacterium]|nr:restriction endonuclease [Candidatus Poribacteria bacterium]